MEDPVFEKMFNEYVKDHTNWYLSDKSTAYYFYKKTKDYYERLYKR